MSDKCMRCPYVRPRRATAQRSFMLALYPNEQYDLDLCDEHAAQFDRDLYVWMDLADIVDVEPTMARPSRVFRPEPRRGVGDEAAAKIRALREKANAGRAPTVVTEEDNRDAFIGPSHDQWLFTVHAQERARERGFDMQDVLKAAAHPHTSMASKRADAPDVYWHLTDECCAVVNRKSKEIITVYTKWQYLCRASQPATKGIA